MINILRQYSKITFKTMTDLSAISENLKFVMEKIISASSKRTQEIKDISQDVRLVAVSKIKPKECIMQAYNDGQRHFGENYVQEMIEKATDSEIKEMCPDIKWHLIGHLQGNKINKLIPILDNLFVIETIDTEKLANGLNEALEKKNAQEVNVMVQVNTSGEEAKSGIQPNECSKLINFILNKCPRLKFIGLMTIGAIDSTNNGPNEDFQTLFNTREKVALELNLNTKDIELSMGMSSDFEEAIYLGSTNVRVGSTIFGARQTKSKS